MSTTDSLALIGEMVVVLVPLAALIWYIINHRSEWKKIFLAGVATVLIMAALLAGVNVAASQLPQSTPSSTSKSTPSPGTAHTVTALATVGPSTTSPQKLLSCSNCPGDTILVTINKITVSTTRMILDTTFTNQSGNDTNFDVRTITLQDLAGGRQPVPGTGTILTEYQSYPTLNAEQSDHGPITFPFVPYIGVAYTLTVDIYVYLFSSVSGSSTKLPFDSITLTCTNSGCQFS